MKRRLWIMMALILSGAISILMSQTSVSAMETDDKGVRWWTIAELEAMSEEADAEREAQCKDETDIYTCKKQAKTDQLAADKKYAAINMFDNLQFMVSSINLKEEKIKILYHDETYVNKWAKTPQVSSGIAEVYVLWLEPGVSSIDYTEYKREDMEGVHHLYAGNYIADGEAWIPMNTEVEISIEGSDIQYNTQNIITYYAMGKKSGFGSYGSISYADCINDANYEEGDECKLYISEEKLMQFRIFKAKKTEDTESARETEDKTNDNAADDAKEDEKVINNQQAEDSESEKEETEELNNSEKEEDNEAQNDDKTSSKLASYIMAPETGSGNSDTLASARTTKLPWWMMAAVVVLYTVLMWSFGLKRGNGW